MNDGSRYALAMTNAIRAREGADSVEAPPGFRLATQKERFRHEVDAYACPYCGLIFLHLEYSAARAHVGPECRKRVEARKENRFLPSWPLALKRNTDGDD